MDEIKKETAESKLVARVVWLAGLLRYVALGLLGTAILAEILGRRVFETDLGYASLALMVIGFIFALGYAYCQFTLNEYDLMKLREQEICS